MMRAMPADTFRLRSSTRNGRFQLAAVLGRGSSGIVYRAHDAELGVDVALKALHSLDAAHFSRLKAEFRSVAGVAHENLVELHELFVDGPECYFTMELVEGLPFVDALRRPSPDRFAGARSVVRQLARALAAIHGAGRLHRDIKPSNVLVTAGHRVVVLDFGLTTQIDTRSSEMAQGPVGTAPYMAPEQAAGAAPAPPADWYSLGVMLFEALTGRLPFEGTYYEVLERKRGSLPPSPRAWAPDVPDDLDTLIARLLTPNPSVRAGLAEVLAATDHEDEAPGTPNTRLFMGRRAELDALARAREQATSERLPVIFRLTGESGIGKTETVREFVAGLCKDPRALVLQGRCHPLESVPYKALDAVVDALTRHLETLSKPRLTSMKVGDREALARIFPGLGRVLPGRPRPDLPPDVGLQEQRTRGFRALGEVLASVAEHRAVTVWIDDLQWGDVDSVLGLREVLRTHERPLPILLILSFRAPAAGTARALQAADALYEEVARERLCTVELRPLDAEACRRLAEALCERHGVASQQVVQAIATESTGIPFFVDAMARRRAGSSQQSTSIALAQVVGERLERLNARERRLLEVISVAGGPLAHAVAIEAAQPVGVTKLDLLRLGNGSLIRLTQLQEGDAVEVYHDRIREVVIHELEPGRKRDTHLRLAETMRKDSAVDPEVLVQHYQEAGDDERTCEFARLAAARADAALAFDRAAELYRLARGLRPDLELYGRLAEALANAGRGVDAARAFGEAADAVAVRAPGDARVVEYRRREGEHYLRSGRLAEGTRCIGQVAAMVGFAIPQSRRRAMLEATLRRARLLFRGLTFEAHGPPATPQTLRRIDSLWGSSTSLSMLDYMVADALGVQHLLEALDAREPSRIIRGLGYEAAFEAILGGPFFWRRCARIVAVMEELANETARPYDLAWARLSKGITAWFHGRWAEVLAACDEAAALFRQNCTGIAWELAIADAYALPTLAYVGRLADLARRVPQALQTADARGDLFAANTCRLGQQNLVYLCSDRPDDALRAAHDGIAPFPRDRYLTPHCHYLLAVTQARLYAGDPTTAWRILEEDWPRLRASQLLRAQFVRIEMRHLRARAALALAAEERRAAHPRRSRELLRIARREAATIGADALPIAAAFSDALEGGIRHVEGDGTVATRHLRSAGQRFADRGMKLMSHAAFLQAGALAPDAQGRAERDAAISWMASEGIRSPAAMASMLVPV